MFRRFCSVTVSRLEFRAWLMAACNIYSFPILVERTRDLKLCLKESCTHLQRPAFYLGVFILFTVRVC